MQKIKIKIQTTKSNHKQQQLNIQNFPKISTVCIQDVLFHIRYCLLKLSNAANVHFMHMYMMVVEGVVVLRYLLSKKIKMKIVIMEYF